MTTLSCQHTMKQLDDYVDHTLSHEQDQAVRAHIETCTPCATRLQQITALQAQLKALPLPQLEPDFAARQLDRFWQQHQARRLSRRWSWTVAASLLLGIALGGGLTLWSGAQAQHATLATPSETFILPLGEVRELRLNVKSSDHVPGASLSLRLPANAELVDYPGEQELNWQADLKQGSNLLILPLRAKGNVANELVLVVLSPAGHQQTKALRLASATKMPTWPQSPGTALNSI